jgi:hypothetical protein
MQILVHCHHDLALISTSQLSVGYCLLALLHLGLFTMSQHTMNSYHELQHTMNGAQTHTDVHSHAQVWHKLVWAYRLHIPFWHLHTSQHSQYVNCYQCQRWRTVWTTTRAAWCCMQLENYGTGLHKYEYARVFQVLSAVECGSSNWTAFAVA